MIYDNFTILMIITITILITSQRVHLHMSAEPPFCSEDFMTWTHGPMDRWGVARNQQKLLVFYRQKWLVKQQNDMVFPLNVDKCGVFSGL